MPSLARRTEDGLRKSPLAPMHRRALAGLLGLVAVLAVPGGPVRAGDEEMARSKPVVSLPEPRRSGEVALERLLESRRSRREFAAEPLPLSAVSQLLWAAQGVTHPSGLRTAPSAGALYPLEIHLVAAEVSGLAPGVYRYDPRGHRLRLEREGDRRGAVVSAALDQDWMADAPVMLVIAAVYRRSERKYGQRAPRYVHMEVGHVAQNVYLQAEALGLGTTMVGAFDDLDLARALGLPTEEKPLGLLPVGRRR
jgi:SagB-type dehydrogenase family enzyme